MTTTLGKQRKKAVWLTILAVLFISTIAVYTAYADHRADRNDYVQWYYGVNDVRGLPGELETNSYHYYWFQALTGRSVRGRWEFSHKIREGWNLGVGPIVIDISIHGDVKTVNQTHHTDSKSGCRRTSYAGLMPGKYHIDAYTLLDLSVTGKGTAVNDRATERAPFRRGMGGPN